MNTYLVTYTDGSVVEYAASGVHVQSGASVLYEDFSFGIDAVKAVLPHHAVRSIVLTQEVK